MKCAYELAHAYGALAIAILFVCPVAPEEAAELYESGSIVIAGRRRLARTVITTCRLMRLREKGCAWWSISEITGVRSPESYIFQRYGIVQEISRREKEMRYESQYESETPALTCKKGRL